MSGIFGQLDQSFRAVWVSNSGAVGLGVEVENLGPEQIAVFAADAYCDPTEGSVSLSSPSFKKHKRVVIKQGIHPFAAQGLPGLSRQNKSPRKSIEFEASDIINWKGTKGDSSPVKPQIVSIGYDGFDASKSLNNIKLDAKPLYVNIRLSGEPIKRYLHRNYVDHRFMIDKGLCVGDCECFDACDKVPCDRIADGIIKHINEQSLFVNGPRGMMYNAPLRQFLKASKLKKCTTPEVAPTLSEKKKWSISICDDGSTTIGKLYAAYPNKSITLDSRIDSISTYSFWQKATDADPAPFTLTTHVQPICDTCPTCPDTYTEVPASKVVQIRVACGADAPTLTGQLSSDLVSSSLSGGDVYLIKVPATTSDIAIETQLDALTCMEGVIIGLESKACVGSEVTFEWASCENCFYTSKEYQIVLPDTDCHKGESRLAELQAAYPDLVIVDDVAGECMHSYKTTTESDCRPEEDCGKLVEYKFTAPSAFEGIAWKEYKVISTDPSCEAPAEVVEPCCVCGVAIETAFWDTQSDECTFGWTNWDPNFKKPVMVQVNIHSSDPSDNYCDQTTHYSTVLQKLSMNTGTSGGYVQELERNHLLYEQKYWSQNPYSNQVSGFKIVAKEHLVYDHYVLTLRKRQYGHSHHLEHQGFVEYHFYIPTGEGKAFEGFMNSLVLSAGNPELQAVIL